MMENVVSEVKKLFEGDTGGHDYWHTMRVYHNAVRIAEAESVKEPCDREIVYLGA